MDCLSPVKYHSYSKLTLWLYVHPDKGLKFQAVSRGVAQVLVSLSARRDILSLITMSLIGCTEVRLVDGTKLKLIAHNEQDDLALYQDQGRSEEHSFASFRAGRGIRPGEDIVVLGFPLSSRLSSSLKTTTGIVSSLLGPEDDRSLFQITASVNPGNSGGPVLDNTGQVVGVVMARFENLNGRPTQNLNFAIHSGIVRLFLDAHGIPYEINLSP